MSYSHEDASLAYARRLQEEFDRLSFASPAAVDDDFALALRLQALETNEGGASTSGWNSTSNDEAYAKRLQREAKGPGLSDDDDARFLQPQEEHGSSGPSAEYSAGAHPPPPPNNKGKAPMLSPLIAHAIPRRGPSPPATPFVQVPQPQIPPPPMPSGNSAVREDYIPPPPPLVRPPSPPEDYVAADTSGQGFDCNDPAFVESMRLACELQNAGTTSMVTILCQN
jgi:hypothetical protein